MLRCRALEIEKSVEKKSLAAFSFPSPASAVTRERISRSRAGSDIAAPDSRLASATSLTSSIRSRKSFTSPSSMSSIRLRTSCMSFIS